jgi:hypothetical protein
MKKFFLIAIISLGLASCWSTTTSDTATAVYTGTGFTINVPKSWVKVEKKSLPTTKNWTIELALTSAEISAWFANNMVILSEELNNKTTSNEYFNVNDIRTSASMLNYQKTSEVDFKFADDEAWKIWEFEAKYGPQTPIQFFLQTAKVCNNKAYLATIAISLKTKTDNWTTKYESLLKSIACTK